ncbi:hypothetical protein TNCV_4393091 [Trichonephila clavipes]|nr:hypothetical protein TNCV_4393091 [Trichonephila clavipes]
MAVIDISSNFAKLPYGHKVAKNYANVAVSVIFREVPIGTPLYYQVLNDKGTYSTYFAPCVPERVARECITCSFVIDEWRIIELFSGYIVNFVKRIRSTSPDMMLVDEMLYAVQTWKKTT